MQAFRDKSFPSATSVAYCQYWQFWKVVLGKGMSNSNSKFRTILRRSSDRPNYQKLLSSLGVRFSEPSNFEFGIAA